MAAARAFATHNVSVRDVMETVHCDREMGPDHPDNLASVHNIAYAYMTVGRTGEAIDLFRRNVADYERVLGPDHPNTMTSRNNLAYACESAGRVNEAIDLYTRTLADRERVLGPDHPSSLVSRKNLAYALDLLIRRVADHPDMRVNLSVAYTRVLRRTDAGRILAYFERVLGPDHPTTVAASGALAK